MSRFCWPNNSKEQQLMFAFHSPFKSADQPQLVECIEKIGLNILENKGILRKIEYLGYNRLYEKLKDPANPTDKKSKQYEANHVLLHFEAPPMYTKKLSTDFIDMSRDVLRYKINRKENLISENYECDLFEDLKPPVYRKTVQKMMETGKQFRNKQEFNNPYQPMH